MVKKGPPGGSEHHKPDHHHSHRGGSPITTTAQGYRLNLSWDALRFFLDRQLPSFTRGIDQIGKR